MACDHGNKRALRCGLTIDDPVDVDRHRDVSEGVLAERLAGSRCQTADQGSVRQVNLAGSGKSRQTRGDVYCLAEQLAVDEYDAAGADAHAQLDAVVRGRTLLAPGELPPDRD